jgi:hypothetical protein
MGEGDEGDDEDAAARYAFTRAVEADATAALEVLAVEAGSVAATPLLMFIVQSGSSTDAVEEVTEAGVEANDATADEGMEVGVTATELLTTTVLLPVRLASTPAARMIAIASDGESQANVVPSLEESGRATHIVPVLHWVGIGFQWPFVHCA